MSPKNYQLKSELFAEIEKQQLFSVNMGWRMFKISFEPYIKDENGQELLGEADFNEGTIKLAQYLEGEVARETLLHELTHVVLETVGLGAEMLEGTKMDNEYITNQITRGYLILFNLNPKLHNLIYAEHSPRI